MASNNFINECKNYANCNRLGKLKIRDDLEISGLEGNTSQETTSGKNLLKPNPLTSGTINGITYSYDEATQTYTFNGTCTTDNTTIGIGNKIIDFTTNTNVTAYYVSGTISGYCRLQMANSDWTKAVRLDINDLSSSKTKKSMKSTDTFTTTVGYENVRFNNGSVATDFKIKVMVANSDDTTYEPYTNGASPNPDYPQEVEVVTGRNEIDIVGKNLCDSGEFTLGTTTSTIQWSKAPSSYIPVNEGETYTLSYYVNSVKQVNNTYGYAYSYIYDENKTRIGTSDFLVTNSANNSTKTIPSGVAYIKVSYGVRGDSGTKFIAQLEKGSIATNFEPYKKQSYEINLGKNLLDKTNVTLNKRISNTGQDYNENGYYTSPFIKVKPNTTYTKNSPTADAYHRFAFYTTNDVSGFITVSSSNSAATPSNCRYIRMCGLQTELDTTQVEKGNQATSYSPYFTPIELCKIGDYQDTIEYRYGSRNLFDKNTIETGHYVTNDGTLGNSNNYSASDYIIVNGMQKVTTSGNTDIRVDYASKVAFYTSDKTFISYGDIAIGSNTYTVPSNAYYMRISLRTSNLDNIQVEVGTTATSYQPYGSGWFIKKNIGKVILNGSETTWALHSSNTNRNVYRITISDKLPYTNNADIPKMFSDYFIPVSNNSTWVVGNLSEGSSSNYIYYVVAPTYTLDTFKTWLSSNNVTTYYVLKTPTYTKIEGQLEEQLETLMNAKGQFGSTTLLVTSSDLPITVDNTITEGLTLNQEDYIQEFTIDSGCYVDGEIIGTVYSKKLETKLIDSKTIDLQNKEFISKVGVVYNDNTNEYEELGKFTVENPKEEQTDNASSFVAYDDLINHIDDRYVTELDYEDEENSITLSDVYEELCRHLELTPVTTTFTNSNIPVNSNPFTNGEKNRDVLKSIEKTSCSFVDIDPTTDEISLKWLSDSLDYTFTRDDYSSLEGGKIVYGPINSLVIKSSVDESENVSIQDSESIAEYGEHQLVITEDYFLYDAALREAAIQAIWNKVHNLTYVDCKLKTYTGKPFLDIGNKIRVYTDENNYFDTYVLKHEFKFNGAFESVIESPALTEQEIKTKQDITLQEKLRNTQIVVNKQEGTITGLVSKTNEIDVTVNNNYQDLNNKFDGYTPLSRTINIENSVTTLQTDTYTKTQIDTKLTDGSVTKVMTTSGTFDIDGMHYEKTNAPTSTTINEVGVGVKKTSDTDYVLFAGYVDDNNTQYTAFKGQTIVASENMLVENYFVVGSKSRMEDYEDGTGVFYIGG